MGFLGLLVTPSCLLWDKYNGSDLKTAMARILPKGWLFRTDSCPCHSSVLHMELALLDIVVHALWWLLSNL